MASKPPPRGLNYKESAILAKIQYYLPKVSKELLEEVKKAIQEEEKARND